MVQQALEVAGRSWAMTCVSMGNPHAITYSVDGQPIKVRCCVCVWAAGAVETCSRAALPACCLVVRGGCVNWQAGSKAG